MKQIDIQVVQQELERLHGQEMYVHLETTNGAYASHRQNLPNVGVFIRNAKVLVHQAKIMGQGPYRAGIKIELGWVYAEGLTSFEIDQEGHILLYGFDAQGKLAVALQLSHQPFKEGLS